MIRKIEMERFSLTTSKRFDEVISSVNAYSGFHSGISPVKSASVELLGVLDSLA